ncbi:MAG TPA: carboxypeptidase regulatory-like domain-containing protein [Syntrophobacteraceae bacterium]|nr:carboxypeptidase regulatory-like domain-containing protein [Syntrophobacteraceae bacterium]
MSKSTLIGTLGAFAVVLVFASLSFAQVMATFSPEQMAYGGVPYISGGVGLDERAQMSEVSHDYNLKLMFATSPSGEYLSNVAVVIRDTRGRKILEAVSEGPWLFTRLPSGKYSVTATAQGKTIQREVLVPGKALAEADFYWKESKLSFLDGGRNCGY